MANTPTQNLLEEEGRITAEKAFTKKGKENSGVPLPQLQGPLDPKLLC